VDDEDLKTLYKESTRTQNLEAQDKVKEFATILRHVNANQDDIDFSTNLFDDSFFDILDKAYMAHLKPAMVSFALHPEVFGSIARDHEMSVWFQNNQEDHPQVNQDDRLNEADWMHAFPLYWKAITTSITAWCETARSRAERFQDTTLERQFTLIIDQIPLKLQLFDLVQCTSYIPYRLVDTYCPIFTKFFYYDLGAQLLSIQDGAIKVYYLVLIYHI
jgi:hypothetical protein